MVQAQNPSLLSQAVLLVNLDSGQVLGAENAHIPHQPASLAQLLTALLVVEELDADRWVLVSPAAAEAPGAQKGLLPYQLVRTDALLEDMLLMSASDAAWALAEAVGGSVNEFVLLMNERAEELGMKHSHFTNPMGLDEPGQYTTAADLAKLAQAVVQHPRILAITAHQNFVWRISGADGLKAGCTQEGGYSTIISAKRDGTHLVVIVLGAKTPNQRWLDAIRWLDFGFSRYGSLLKEPMIADVNGHRSSAHP